ncbi:PilN domain-containing protein [Pseudomonas sp. 1912-s]|uniref:PilN domain-containing protein n=1 Tax=Pseudomonas sp. 1912-s TaxID=3033802 RepID=UPI0023DE9ED5|nr:PilN domain-containing protein [Pseudomonas sp. 1912-s]MDF3202953.1 PilN domain-containing protein [Pseudomonas sp. 1912-s]
MFLSLVNSIRYEISKRWRHSSFPKFFAWWSDTLLGCLSPSIRQRLIGRNHTQIIQWPLCPSQNFEKQRAVTLILDIDRILRCDFHLPLNVAQNLRSVLRFELDRLVPFNSDQVYFDACFSTSESSGVIHVLLVVIERNRLDLVVDEAHALGLQVSKIDVLDHEGRPLGLNLLPKSLRATQAIRLQQYKVVLRVSILVVTLAILTTWVGNRERGVIDKRAEVSLLRNRAMEVDGMRKQIQARADMDNAINLRTHQAQEILTLLNRLTNCIPLDTWLEQFEARVDGSLTLSGLSRHAGSLPAELVRCADLEKASFQGGVQPDTGSGMERFNILAHRRKLEG